MSKLKQNKVLTDGQARDLRWFCKNCTGLRQEFYELLDKMNRFKDKLDRLNKTSELIEEFFKENNINETNLEESISEGQERI